MPKSLSEQVVVLTGASSGIGREAATLFGERGASVVLAARDEAALREVAAAGVRAFPLQTIYSMTKHGVKALSEGLRLELKREPGEYHVTVIAPAAINTPLFERARSKMGAELDPPPPIYDPEIVAESIVFAA